MFRTAGRAEPPDSIFPTRAAVLLSVRLFASADADVTKADAPKADTPKAGAGAGADAPNALAPASGARKEDDAEGAPPKAPPLENADVEGAPPKASPAPPLDAPKPCTWTRTRSPIKRIQEKEER